MEEKKLTLRENLASLDKLQLSAILVLYILGMLSIYSAGAGRAVRGTELVIRQGIWGILSCAVFFTVLQIGYERLFSFAYRIYMATILLLLAVIVLGLTVKGSRSWFGLGSFRIQPAEFGKVALAIVLGKHLCRFPPRTPSSFAGTILLAALTGGLVLIQPDAGSAMVYGVIAFAALVVAGTPGKYSLSLVGSGIALLPFAWSLLKEYQKSRLLVFLDPWSDPLGAGYNVIQSRIAIGSGGLFGKGFMQGMQSKLRFLPEPHTDFIFSVFSEEFGFLGAIFVLLLFGFLFWRLIDVGIRTKDARAKILVAGIVAWIWFQVVESIGMSMGLLPITGLPLPLMSYGGSSLLALSIALALVQSVYISTLKSYE